MEELQNPYNRYRDKALWYSWEINHGARNENARNPFSKWDQPQLYSKWKMARELHIMNPNVTETTPMSNEDQLYKYGEQYVKRLATDSKGQAVVEDASTGTIFAVDPTKLELVVPYTVGIKFQGNETVYHYLAAEGAVEKGDLLIQGGSIVKMAMAVEINTKSLQATAELKSAFQRKLKTEAF